MKLNEIVEAITKGASAAYVAAEAKGATMPDVKSIVNLAGTIESIQNGSKYKPMRGPYDETKGREGTKIVFAVEAGQKIFISRVTKASSSPSFTIDWGDGDVRTFTTGWDYGGALESTFNGSHVYAVGGEYTVTVSDDVTFVSVHGSSYRSNNQIHYMDRTNKMSLLSVRACLQWGTKITTTENVFCCCHNMVAFPCWNNAVQSTAYTYAFCYDLCGDVPAWSPATTNAQSTYQYCFMISGSIPNWGDRIANAQSTYDSCFSLIGGVPSWGASITTAANTFIKCYGLTGAIPPWTDTVTSASSTYAYCSGLSGSIPRWGAGITNATETYYCNPLLTSAWDGATDEELMPTRITSYARCVSSCGTGLRALFTSAWGGTK